MVDLYVQMEDRIRREPNCAGISNDELERMRKKTVIVRFIVIIYLVGCGNPGKS